jgi:hypothetical protein
VDQHDRLTLALVGEVQLDRQTVLGPDGKPAHVSPLVAQPGCVG